MEKPQINPAAPDGLNLEDLKNTLQDAGRFCHTLNQPLQTIMMTVEMMLEDVPYTDPLYENLEIIMGECEKMAEDIKEFRPKIKSQLESF